MEPCRFRVVAVASRHVPTMDQARRGVGQGYRPSRMQKKQALSAAVQDAVDASDQRRLASKAGKHPFAEVRLCCVLSLVSPLTA